MNMLARSGSANRARLREWGFTLTELVVVVAIVGILAAIAYPSYQDSVRKSRRADAKAALMENAQFMERVFVESKAYNTVATADLPVQQTPKDGTPKFYDLALTATATTYTLTATPKAATDQDKDKCYKLSVTDTGSKAATDKSNNPVADCW